MSIISANELRIPIWACLPGGNLSGTPCKLDAAKLCSFLAFYSLEPLNHKSLIFKVLFHGLYHCIPGSLI